MFSQLGWKINKGLSNNGAGLFLKRTGNFRKLMKLSCNVPLKDYTPATVASVEASRKTIRRKSDILWAFFRQGVREQRVGFHPKSEMAKVPFNNDTFWQDPCRPYLSDLLTEEEKAKYAATPVKLRVAKVSREILQEAEEMSMNLDPTLYNYYMQNMNVAMANIQAQYSGSSAVLPENGGAMPFVYQHMVLVLLWLFLLLTPLAARKAAEDKLDHSVVECSGCMSCASTFMQAGCDQAAYTPTPECKNCDKQCAQNLLDMSSCSLSAAASYSYDPYSMQGECLRLVLQATPHSSDSNRFLSLTLSPSGLLMVVLITVCYFGVYEASCRLNNPWGWDRCDYNLEKTGLTIVKQGSRVMSTRIISESSDFDGKGKGN